MNQVLSFKVSGRDFAVELQKIQEIRAWEPSTPMPYTPPYVEGLMSLRGNLIPVFCLRKRLDLPQDLPVQRPIVIVFDLGSRMLGAKVDEVCDVFTLDDANIRPAPELGSASMQRFVKNLATMSEDFIVILDIEKVLDPGEVPDDDAKLPG